MSGEGISTSARTSAEIAGEIVALSPAMAAAELDLISDQEAAAVLAILSPALSEEVMLAMAPERRAEIFAAAPAAYSKQWTANFTFPENTVGRLMEPPRAVFREDLHVAEAVDRIRLLVKDVFVTYGYIVDVAGKLQGVVAMRDLLVAEPTQLLADIMLRDPFTLAPDTPVLDAMKRVVNHHFPVYPVCTDGRLVGIVRGRSLFEHQAYEISAQAGAMVGIEKEERLATSIRTSFRFRHPWLQLNLMTAFLAAGVVALFQSTLDRVLVLALFLPVLAGQSGNTGCQSLAVTLRGMTLGDLQSGGERRLVWKEGFLGLCNGILVGLTAGAGMGVIAWLQGDDRFLLLGLIVVLAMVGSCIASGIAGAVIPLALRRLGADPATASCIFLTTATDVSSIGLFLGIATLLL